MSGLREMTKKCDVLFEWPPTKALLSQIIIHIIIGSNCKLIIQIRNCLFVTKLIFYAKVFTILFSETFFLLTTF